MKGIPLRNSEATKSVRPKLRAYCLPWHKHSSPAFRDIMVEPLRDHVELDLASWPPSEALDLTRPLVFCQIQPPPEVLAASRAKIVWLPMWDQARHFAPGWWSSLPKKNLRVLAFASPVEREARRAGITCLRVRFHKDPADFPAVQWDGPRTLFYWNRTGLFGRNLLDRLIRELSIERLIFRAAPDPGFEACAYELPTRINDAEVVRLGGFADRSIYDTHLRTTNFYLAPRLYEGVGLSYIEALCSGCAVLAHNTSTMNEYISHRRTGWLFPSIRLPLPLERLRAGIHRRWPAFLPHGGATTLSIHQDWRSIRNTDWRAIGRAARAGQTEGHRVWQSQLPKIARFLVDW